MKGRGPRNGRARTASGPRALTVRLAGVVAAREGSHQAPRGPRRGRGRRGRGGAARRLWRRLGDRRRRRRASARAASRARRCRRRCPRRSSRCAICAGARCRCASTAGGVTVLAFLDSACTACVLIAQQMRGALDQLAAPAAGAARQRGSRGGHARARASVPAPGVAGRARRYLVGPRAALAACGGQYRVSTPAHRLADFERGAAGGADRRRRGASACSTSRNS